MNKLKESIINRHSVRAYSDKHIEDAKVAELQDIILKYNAAIGLNMQLITDEPEAFNCFLAHYGKFRGVRNYIAMVGPKDQKEACGYCHRKYCGQQYFQYPVCDRNCSTDYSDSL